MTHPAKPAPLETRDEPVWLGLLALADDRQRIRIEEPGDLGICLGVHDVHLPQAELDAAVERIAATGRIEREPGGLRVCVEVFSRKPYQPIYGSLPASALWTAASPAIRVLWLVLLGASDARGRVDLPLPDLARIALLDLDAAEAALVWLVDDERIERLPEGALQIRRFERLEFTAASRRIDGDKTNGSTEKGQREKGTGE